MKKLMLVILIAYLHNPINALTPGVQEDRQSSDNTPRYTEPEPGEGIYTGLITNGNFRRNVTNISFCGITKIYDARREMSDSHDTLRLSHITSIKITDPYYHSPHHSTDKEQLFIKADITMNTAQPGTESYLLPHEIHLCAEEIATKVQSGMRLRDITELTIDHTKSRHEDDIEKKGTDKLVKHKSSIHNESWGSRWWHSTITSVKNTMRRFKSWIDNETPQADT
jgi:hypothetical protein